MHISTHLEGENQGKTGISIYPAGMVERYGYVGQLLQKLESPGVRDNTIIGRTTDCDAEITSWPRGGMTPFKGKEARLPRFLHDPLPRVYQTRDDRQSQGSAHGFQADR
jgi:arylsulfatase A-like enzyme